MKPIIGFNRHLEMNWLTQTAIWAAGGFDGVELKKHIDSLLAPSFSSQVAMDKTRNLLFGIWSSQSKASPQSFHDEACKLLLSHSEQSLVLHWGLLIARYPFFYSVVSQLGRMARHDRAFVYGQLEQRVADEYGDTSTIKRSMQFVIRTLTNLGLISNAKTGVYQLSKPITVTSPVLVAWLAQAIILANDDRSRSLERLNSDPAVFPFDLLFSENSLSQSACLELHHQASDTVVFLN
ncbi:hypothetical protein [Shewanella xiamenensis]|uniref:hypothetical protein n=1 Tax=Shewanella xiamenensis TaxID=332186 RepID=UPI0008498CC1|nr:hypothetical protein [Shewanella xiamenensis]ODR87376.1 hypothetical protein ABT47_20020 [Shewanella xiamenensis]